MPRYHNATDTSQGLIPHIVVNGFTLVVKLVVKRPMTLRHPPKISDDGYLVYATPGGGEYVYRPSLFTKE